MDGMFGFPLTNILNLVNEALIGQNFHTVMNSAFILE